MPVSRLRFLSASGAATASLVAGAVQNPPVAEGATAAPRVAVGQAKAFLVGKPVAFHYPDAQAPALAVKIGHKVDGGVGPDGDIVAYKAVQPSGCTVQLKVDQWECNDAAVAAARLAQYPVSIKTVSGKDAVFVNLGTPAPTTTPSSSSTT